MSGKGAKAIRCTNHASSTNDSGVTVHPHEGRGKKKEKNKKNLHTVLTFSIKIKISSTFFRDLNVKCKN
jgi:hypothetical protein